MLNRMIVPFLMSLAAGLSTGIGGLMVVFVKKRSERVLSFALGFSAGVMMLVSFGDLLPEAAAMLWGEMGPLSGGFFAILAFFAGLIFAAGLDRLVPEGNSGEIGRVGLVSMLAMILHNLPEGMATFLSGYKDISLGLSITIAVALHNIPEGISIAIPLYYAGGRKKKAIGLAFLSGLSEPVGAVLAAFLLGPFLNDMILGFLFGMIAGIMVYIAFNELVPTAQDYGDTGYILMGILLGMLAMGIGMLG